MSKYEVIVDGPINLSGMGNLTRGFIECLNEMSDIKLKLCDNKISPQLGHTGLTNEEIQLYDELSKTETSTNALYIQIGSPRIFKKVPFKYNIGYTLFESDGFHPFYVHQCNNLVDEVWTGGKFNKQTFSVSGVNKKIRIVPPFINTEIYKPGIEKLKITNLRKYIFQSNFDMSWRKGMDKLLHAYWDEFTDKDDVCLILKTFSGDDSEGAQKGLMNQINFLKKKLSLADKKTAPVLFFGSFLDQKYMSNFSNTCDCYVSASRGEGFNLPLAEAMSLEKQVISTKWSTPIEYCNKKNGYMIDLTPEKPLEPITDSYQLRTEQFYEGQSMANPDINCLKSLLHKVIEEKESGVYTDKTKEARNTIVNKYSKEVIKRLFLEAIVDIFENKQENIEEKGLFS